MNSPLPRAVVTAMLCGLLLRWGTAVLTEFHPIFPPHYYIDAQRFHNNARDLASHWRGAGPMPAVEPASRLYTVWTAALYRVCGERPLVAKLANGLASMAGAFFWYRIALLCASPSAAALALWIFVLWPTNIFFGSQNLKDPQLGLISAGLILMYLRYLDETPAPLRLLPAIGCALLLLAGLYRTVSMLFLAAALLATFAATALRASRVRGAVPRPLLLACLSVLAAVALFKPVSRIVFDNVAAQGPVLGSSPTSVLLTPAIINPAGGGEIVSPWSPRGLTRFRQLRHSQDRQWASAMTGREIGTQIFPDAEFRTWLDVAAFLPKGMFYTLFMPLPGLYPSDGRLGRTLASVENAALLLLFLLAAAGLARARPLGSAALLLATLFSLSAVAYGIFEFDLGAATRHRLQYFPCLLPFAAPILAQRSTRRPRREAS